MTTELLLLGSGFVAGIINAVAGGGSIVVYPLLLSLGIPPVTANATGSVVIWPGSASSAYGYRKHLKTLPRRFYLLIIPCIFGGILGAYLLGHTSNRTFEYIVPWFMIIAVILLSLQTKIHQWLYSRQGLKLERDHQTIVEIIIAAALLILATYGGYFGAGFGIMMLAFLGFSSLTDIYQMNGLKNLTALALNAVAIIYFIAAGLIAWSVLPLLVIGNTLGGWVGATYSERLPAKEIRLVIIIIGIVVSAALLVKLYA